MAKWTRKSAGMALLIAALTGTSAVFYYAHHETRLALGFSRDVNEALAAFIESEHFGFAILDEDGEVVEWNPGMEALTGYTKTEMQRNGMRPLMPTEEDYDKHHTAFAAAMERARGGEAVNRNRTTIVNCEVQNRSGQGVPIKITVRIIKAKASGRLYALANTDNREVVHVVVPEKSKQ